MAIKQFFAGNNARVDDGYQGFETLGRRVGGQYDQAGNDLRDIGRAKADAINMVGRWPFNIIELEQRAFKSQQQQAGGQPAQRGLPGTRYAASSRGSSTDEQFAPRVMPDLSTLNEMSEGAAYLGRSLGGPSQLPYVAERSRLQYQQLQREQERKLAASQDAWQKRWDLYEKGLADYNKGLDKRADELYKGAPDSSVPTYDSTGYQFNPTSGEMETTYGGGSDNSKIVTETNPLTNKTTSTYETPPAPEDYGGSGGWFW